MSSTPDLSKIVGLIMQNPDLIEQISALAKENTDSIIEEPAAEESTQAAVQITESEPTGMRSHRRELLSAMKPYLSENRKTALDSMASILDIIDVMMKK